MALPTRAQIQSMDYLDWSLPSFYVNVESSGGGGGGGTPVSNNAYVNVNGTWKQSDDIYVNVSGSWKNVTDDIVYVNINGSWKNLTSGGGGGGGGSSIDSTTMDYLSWSLPVVGKG